MISSLFWKGESPGQIVSSLCKRTHYASSGPWIGDNVLVKSSTGGLVQHEKWQMLIFCLLRLECH